MRKRILVLAPCSWDLNELRKPKYQNRYEFIFQSVAFYDSPLFLIGFKFNVLKFIDEMIEKGRALSIDGVIGTHDYPASLIAAAVAQGLGLPSPRVEQMLLCSHKFLSRQAQKEKIPECTPRFELVDPFRFREEDLALPLPFPFFMKPVKGTLSIRASAINNRADLEKILSFSYFEKIASQIILKPFNQLLQFSGLAQTHANYFIAEELLQGQFVSLDGFVFNGEVTFLGTVDSIMYPETISFQRFLYPTVLDESIQHRLEEVAKLAVLATGFDNGCFNVELAYNKAIDSIHIVEINPRISSQFGDIYEKVDGTSSYEVQLSLATGQKPQFQRRGGKYGRAASFVLRTFEDKKVLKLPSESDLEYLKVRFPDSVIEVLCKKGRRLSREPQDMDSYRYAIANIGLQQEEDLVSVFGDVERNLNFQFKE